MLTLTRWTLVWITLGIVHGDDIRIHRSIRCANWGSWSDEDVSDCSVECGTGVMTETRRRICRYPGFFGPYPPHGCNFAQVEETRMSCDTEVDCTGTPGDWGSWSAIGICDYCRTRRQTFTRRRSCSDGELCEGGVTQTKQLSCIRRFQQLQFCYYCRDYRTFIFPSSPPVITACIFGSLQGVRCPDSRGDLYRSCGRVKSNPLCRLFAAIESRCVFPLG